MSKIELTTEQKIDSIISNNTKDFEINVANWQVPNSSDTIFHIMR